MPTMPVRRRLPSLMISCSAHACQQDNRVADRAAACLYVCLAASMSMRLQQVLLLKH